MDYSSNRDLRYTCEEYARSEYGPLLKAKQDENASLIAENRRLREKNSAMERDASHGRAIAKMLAEINDDPGMKNYWEKILMLMRLRDNG